MPNGKSSVFCPHLGKEGKEKVNMNFRKVFAWILILTTLCLCGCAALKQEDHSEPEATADATQPPAEPRRITLACLQEDGYESLKSWEILAAQENFMLEVVSMTLEDYWLLSEAERPDIVYCNGQENLSRIPELLKAAPFAGSARSSCRAWIRLRRL